MRVRLIQSDIIWRDISANMKQLESILFGQKTKADLTILPEMFTTGFDMNPQSVAHGMDDDAIRQIKKWAFQLNTAILGSLIVLDDGKYYNRMLCIKPDGSIEYYDKRHLFSLAGEQKSYTKGKTRKIFEIKGWKICPQICYDLRFPVWSRNTAHYDLLIYVANWPKPRIDVWKLLLQARAIENLCYVIGVNRIGKDPNANNYNGQSAVIQYDGKLIRRLDQNEISCDVSLDRTAMLQYRETFGFLNDQDSFEIQI